MKYFGHDCDAGEDSKLVKVVLKYDIRGYGVYFRCNELIGRRISEQCSNCVLEEDLDVLSDKFKLKKNLIQEMLEYFVEVGLFDKSSDGKYSNLKLLTRLDIYTQRKLRTKDEHTSNNVSLKEKKRNENKVNEKPPTAGGADKTSTDNVIAFKKWYSEAYKQIFGSEYIPGNYDDKEIAVLLAKMDLRSLIDKTALILHSTDSFSAKNLSTLKNGINRLSKVENKNEIAPSRSGSKAYSNGSKLADLI